MARSTFKVLFYVNGSKEKNGIVPIMGRVTINGTGYNQRNGSTVQLQADYSERALGCQREQGKGQEYGSEGNQSCT